MPLPRLLRTPAERRHALALLDRIEEHGDLDDKQRNLVIELRGLLPAAPARNGAKAPKAPKAPKALPPPPRKPRTRVAPRSRAARA